MAGAARFPFFHARHADSVALRLVVYRPGMAVAAMVGLDMLGMFENGRAGFPDLEGDLLDRMAGGAFVDPKGLFAVVAGATRFTLFHIRHGCAAVGSCREQGRMADCAVRVDCAMFPVAEVSCSGCLDRIDNLLGLVATDAFLYGKGVPSVMTGAAGFPFHHIGHGETGLLLEVVNPVVTDLAVVGHAFVTHMNGVAENNLARISGLEGHVLDFHRRGNAAGEQQEWDNQKEAGTYH